MVDASPATPVYVGETSKNFLIERQNSMTQERFQSTPPPPLRSQSRPHCPEENFVCQSMELENNTRSLIW